MKHHRAIWRNTVGLLVAVVSVLAGVSRTLAAPLSYSDNSNLYLSTPEIALTIQAGSVVDALTINATSVVVTLSSSTAGTFTLTSPQALSSSTVGSGGAEAQTCSSGIETDTITQTSNVETYTLTPTGSPCSTPSSGGGSEGGGGGSGGGGVSVGVPASYGSPSVSEGGIIASSSASSAPASSTTSSMSSSTSALQTELNALLAELARLQAEAGESSSTSTSSNQFVFTRNLYWGITGNDVKELQTFLISQNSGPAARRLAAHGTTKTFATLTLNALTEFQKDAGILPASGYFGPITRAYVNKLEEAIGTTIQS